ncbi:AI-2E family transporter [Cumulibacter soli]|uniref:AI-2E family transporter n=1 Tax=Cumulibacter soli TaxID=2546344 RepID=UPI0014195F77|nr:AI-2E family transporter [Cumulibacter soli]
MPRSNDAPEGAGPPAPKGEARPKPAANPVHLPWPKRNSDLVTPSLNAMANWAWRFLLVVAALWVLAYILGFLSTVTIPLAIAVLLAALLMPAKNWLLRHRMNPMLATIVVFVGGLVLVIGLITLVIQQFVQGAPMLAEQATGGLDQVREWLAGLGWQISDAQLNGWFDTATDWIGDNSDMITSGALNTAISAGHFLAGFLLALFSLFFFLKDGAKIWAWLLKFVPAQSRGAVDGAAERSWATLGGYVKATALVALVDAVGIGIGLLILQVPLVVPLAALVFLSAFIPMIGATLSGAVAVLIALVTVNPLTALLTLGVVVLVQQLESNFLQPLLLGKAVKVHPLAVILSIAAGALIAGVIGALLAVPVAAAANAALKFLRQEPTPIDTEKTPHTSTDAAPDL